jgi:hypothetical protein
MAIHVGDVPRAYLARSLGADDRRRVTLPESCRCQTAEADQRRLMRVEQQLFSKDSALLNSL